MRAAHRIPEYAMTIAVSGEAIAREVIEAVSQSVSLDDLHHQSAIAAHVLSKAGVPDQVSV